MFNCWQKFHARIHRDASCYSLLFKTVLQLAQVYATWKNPYAPGDSGARKNPQGPNPIKKVTQRKPEADFWKYGASSELP